MHCHERISRDLTKLSIEPVEVECVPGLNDLAIRHAHETHAGKRDRSLCCGNPEAIAKVRSSYHAPKCVCITISDAVLDINANVRKRLSKRVMQWLKAGWPANVVATGILETVNQSIGCQESVDLAALTLVPNQLEPLMHDRVCIV